MTRRTALLPALQLLAVAACTSGEAADGLDAAPADASAGTNEGSAAPDVSDDPVEDSGADDVDTVHDADAAADTAADPVADPSDGDPQPDADTPVGPWVRTYSDTTTWPAPDGTRWTRAIVHLHSTHSHDACDDDPRPGGVYNEPCLADLRRALCDTRVDVAWLTDHPEHFIEVPFTDALLHRPGEGDQLDLDELDRPVANRLRCGDGREVIIRAGAEARLMPLGLRQHVDADEAERERIHGVRSAEAAGRMRDAGALVWQAHTEERSLEELRAFDLDGIEVYQLHANIDPNIRRDSLGLDPTAPLTDLVPFVVGETTTHPDLSFLAFLEPNQPSLDRWAALLADGPMVGTGGTDAHQNVLRAAASDGERLDSYRRMIAWFSNYVLVDGALDWASAETALAAGRVLIGFDTLGDPAGFAAAVVIGDTGFAMGSTVAWAPGATLQVRVAAPVAPSGTNGATSTRVLAADGEGWRTVATFDAPGDHVVALDGPGIYRVEVWTTGAHLAPYLADFPALQTREYPWLMTNAWRVLAE
jgi:hypothetical protein